ncbi:MAG: YbhN family protein [Crocinitomicaceae bacterium]
MGFGLIWLFYDALCPQQKTDLFNAFKTADYKWVLISLVIGWLSHLSRAYRQLYLLKPLGYEASFWNSYHALMSGYLVNLAFPRAGEPYRASVLNKKEKIPFQKVFGTILAERTIDVVMLGIITLIMILLQMDKIDLFIDKMSNFSGQSGCGNSMAFSILGGIVKWGIIIGFFGGLALFLFKKSIRNKIIEFVKGIIEGAFAIFKSKDKVPFIGHTLFIWMMYMSMFSICFYAIPETASLGIDAMLAGFVAGTVGMIVVQGGIGVYPAFVGLIITIYISKTGDVGISPEALALGWIIWTSQTVMMIFLGLISFIVSSKKVVA